MTVIWHTISTSFVRASGELAVQERDAARHEAAFLRQQQLLMEQEQQQLLQRISATADGGSASPSTVGDTAAQVNKWRREATALRQQLHETEQRHVSVRSSLAPVVCLAHGF